MDCIPGLQPICGSGLSDSRGDEEAAARRIAIIAFVGLLRFSFPGLTTDPQKLAYAVLDDMAARARGQEDGSQGGDNRAERRLS